MIVGIFVLVILTVLFIVFFERAMRKILINYPKRQVGNKMGEFSHLPLKLIQPALSRLFSPQHYCFYQLQFQILICLSDTFKISSMFTQGQPLYMLLYASGIIFSHFFTLQ